MLKARDLGAYRDLLLLFTRYGRKDFRLSMKPEDLLAAEEPAGEIEPDVKKRAEAFANHLKQMGPTYVKFGQILSTRPDIVPPEYIAALESLQDQVEPFSFAEVEKIVQEELGVRISKAFAEFEPTPLAAASLGQVHRAQLRSGRRVAVKVQRPGVREQVMQDLDALAAIGAFIDDHTEVGHQYEFARMIDEFRRSVLRELDYIQEGGHLVTFKRNLAGFERLLVPAPVEDYTTSRVLTMDYVPGTKITALSRAVLLEVDGAGLAEQLYAAYLKQVLVDGFFHADPHPGNVLLTEDGRLALLDLGMVARVTPRMQDALLQVLIGGSDGHADVVATYAMKLGQPREAFDEVAFRRRVADLVARSADSAAEPVEVGRMVLELARLAAESGLRLPPELSMLGKTLLSLDEVARTLQPEITPNALVRQHAAALMQQRMADSVSPARLLTTVLETKELMERLPERVNRILDRLANNDIEVKVDAIDEARLMEGFQKVANRITLGLLLAALIVGAALLMQVETSFRILGYPGLAIVSFLLAAAGGVALILAIIFWDQ